MSNKLGLLAAGLLAAALASPAHAAIYSTSFSGAVVATPAPVSGPAVGAVVSGSFTYSSDANRFLSFTINGVSAAQPLTSSFTISPSGVANPYEAVYEASTSVAQGTGTANSAFTLDLLAYTNFPTASASGILTTPNLGSLLETQANSFDGNFSEFSYYSGTSNAVTRSFTVALDPASLSTQVPEPASLALLAVPVVGMMVRRRR